MKIYFLSSSKETLFHYTMHKLNFTVSPSDTRDYVIVQKSGEDSIVLTSTPQIDLSSGCTSVKDQGPIGSCTAHAGVALLEYNNRKFTKDTTNDVFSERFTYFTTRVNIAKWSAQIDSGAYLRDTLKSFIQYGCCGETKCPYLSSSGECKFSEQPSTEAYSDAMKYQTLSYLNIPVGTTLATRQTALTTLKNLLLSGFPFIGGFRCYENLYDGVKGCIPLPNGHKAIGGHAVCFVGYDDITKLFKFKNSWGSVWGDNGYGYLPYQYLLNGDLTDLWTIYTQEKDDIEIGGTQVVKPKTSKEILDQTVRDGLLAISQNILPVIPTVGISKSTQLALRGYFNRVITMKSQLR